MAQIVASRPQSDHVRHQKTEAGQGQAHSGQGVAVGTRSMDAEASRATPFDDAAQIRRAMLAAVGARERVRAIVLPRSLVIRPGSAFADRDALA